MVTLRKKTVKTVVSNNGSHLSFTDDELAELLALLIERIVNSEEQQED